MAKTLAEFPEAEIVISDNCSTDDTRTTQLMSSRIKYVKQETISGPFPTLRQLSWAVPANTVVYLGDDDYLLPQKVASGIEFLEANPGVVCYYAPCQLYDEVNQKIDWNAFYPAEDETFHDAADLWNFLIH